ncbi:MAG: hypothetical protein HYV67_02450, partial [Candidatus Taylorbacteria bacterium]|nr:hypothetical protein [Candidatus Taylorbacteria bacterium]
MATNKTRPARGGRGRGGTWLITFFIAAVAVGLAFSPAGGFKAAVFAQTDFNPAIPPQSVEDIEALEAYRSFDPTVPPQSVEDIEALNAYTRASNAADAYTGGSGVTQGADNPGAKAAAVQEKGAPPKKPKTIGCIALTVLGVPVAFNWDACAANIVYLIMWIFSWILWLAGIILDMSIYYTLNLSDLMSHVPVVDIGWKIFRDLANILFIFILLWIAIGTILGLVSGKTKEMVFHLVIVALLMNFSLFITKAVIDGSNIVALHFYNLIVTPSAGRTGLAALTPNSSFSGAFMEGLRIQTLYDPQTAGGQALRDTGSFTDFAAQVSGVVINMGKVILMGLLGIILMLTAAYVFLVAAILFIIRVVVLMMVMILSPLAFLAFALPAAKEYAEVWRKQLINQSLFAPLYLALSYVVVGTIQSDAFKYGVMSVNRQDTTAAAAATVTSAAAVFGIGPGGAVSTAGFAFVFNFIILIALMLASILVAKKMGAIGVETAVKLGKEARGFVGRQIMRGTYVTAAGGVVGYGAKGVGAVVGRIPGLKNVGDKISGFGEKTMEGAERVQKKIDIAELDKKFGKSTFGRTELGDFIRQETTGGALFGVKAKFGAEKTVKQAYEESEKLRELREDTRNKEAVQQAADRLKIAEQAEKAYARPDIKNFTDKDGKVDEQGFAAAEQTYIEKLKEILRPKRDDFENSSDFDAAEKFYRKIVEQLDLKQPKRADFSTQAEFDAALTAYENRPLERPTSHASTTELKVAQIMYDNIEKQKTMQEKDTEEKRAAVGTAMNFLSPQGFAELSERDIKELAP